MAFPYRFGSPTPVIITDQSGSTGTSANIPTTDAADGAVNTAAPVFAIQIGWLDAGGKLQAISAANPLPVTGGGGGGGNAAAGATGSPVPADAGYTGFQDGSGNLIGVSAANPLPISGSFSASIAPATSGGCLDYHVVSAGSTNAANIKASAGQIYGWHIFNNAAYPVYVKFYNTAGTPTPGTGVLKTIGIQSGTHVDHSQTMGIAFGTGIGISITKGIADADATAVLASDCVVDIEYK